MNKMLRFIAKSTSRTLLTSAQNTFSSTQRFYGKHCLPINILKKKYSKQNFSFGFLATLPKRFYKNAGVLSCDGKYEISLDTKKLKTPSGAVFQVKNETLAIAGMYIRTDSC